MSITKRTIIIVGSACLVALTVLFLVSDEIYLKKFEVLERDQVVRNINRVNEALSARLDALNTFCYDWAAWDDTYQFAKEYNLEFIDRNFQDETFSSSKINVMLIFNTSGEMVAGKAFDLVKAEEIALPGDLPVTISDEGLLNPASLEDGTSGTMLFSGQPMQVVSRQVLTSLGEGPSTGTIIMGRFLDLETIAGLETTTQFSVKMFAVPSEDYIPELEGITGSENDVAPSYVKTLNSKTIAGFTFIKDFKGNPVEIVEIDIPRDIYAQGIKATSFMHSSFFIGSILFCGLVLLLIKKFVLSRVTALSSSVNKIGSVGKMTGRIPVQGNDELTRLSENINDMLESLEKSEMKRRSQKELISHILANTLNGILAITESGNIIQANKAFITLFGLDMVSISGQNIFNLPTLAGLIPEIRAFLESLALTHKTEIKYLNNGSNKTFIANFARMNEQALAFLILTDVTDERAEQERLYMTDRLASIGEMASGIAHELNNPLTGILGLSAILAEEELPETVREDIVIIRDEAQRAAEIVKNMLSFARRHSPKKEFSRINKIVEDVLKLRSYEHRVTDIIVENKLDPDLPKILVDYFQIQQVFINIVLNAEQAMADQQGKRTIKITTEKVDSIIRISFTDSGPGISPQHLGRIFNPFFTTKEVGRGTGLGLSISYGIITAHNGAIYARNETGRGATFVVELPISSSIVEEIFESVEQYQS
jgi:PAS domain S-box-containing protein